MRAGRLSARVAFDARADADDGHGNRVGAWQERFVVSARVVPRIGGESVVGARLAGVQPLEITVRASPQTRAIGSDWRVRHGGETYLITAPPALSERGDEVRILCRKDPSA